MDLGLDELMALYTPSFSYTCCLGTPSPKSECEPKIRWKDFFTENEFFFPVILTLLERLEGEEGGVYLVFMSSALRDGTESERVFLGVDEACSDRRNATGGCLTTEFTHKQTYTKKALGHRTIGNVQSQKRYSTPIFPH